MSEAWLTRTQSRGELDASSSASLARSIYGSQAYFDASSWQAGSEANLFHTTSQINSGASTTRHLSRPKSSPARAIAERNQKLRPSSAMPSSYSAGQFNKMRPVSASPMRGRPTSALQHGRPTSALQHGRPTSALQHGRPTSAVQRGYPIKRRPQSAAPWATPHEPLIEVEDYDELVGARSTARIQSANPVTLNSIPEYIKVWEGKPLLPRDYGLKHFDRKPWQRPKSDYGLRSGGWRRRRKTSKDGMGPVISEIEIDEGSHDNKTKLAWGQDDGWDGKNGDKSLFDDINGRRGLGDLNDGQGGSDGRDGYTGNYGDGSGSSSSNLRNANDDSDLWASRMQPPKEDSDSDDDFFKKKPSDCQWMNYRMALARHSTRFELPMDMKRLETMSPEQYLCTHCIVSDRRVQHYKRIFTAAKKKSRSQQPAGDCLHGYEDLVAAIVDAHYESLSEEEIYEVIDVVCLSPEQTVDFKLFCGVCALTERMYRDKFVSSRSSGPVHEYGRYKEIVEDADFEALDWKLRGCKISKSLRTLFSHL